MVQWMKKHDEYKTSKIKHFHIIKLLKIDTNFSIDYDNTVLIFNQTGRMGYLIGPWIVDITFNFSMNFTNLAIIRLDDISIDQCSKTKGHTINTFYNFTNNTV